MAVNFCETFFFAFTATVAFGVLFQAPRTTLPVSGLIGAAGWLLFSFLRQDMDSNSFVANCLAALLIALASELAARLFRQPATTFIVPGIIPLVPGLGMYQGMSRIIAKNYDSGISTLLTAVTDAAAIALGIMFITSVFRVFKMRKNRRNAQK